MKNLLKLEEILLALFFAILYFNCFEGTWSFLLLLFLAPDLSFFAYLAGTRIGAIAYNATHHKGAIALVGIVGWWIDSTLCVQIALIFLIHTCFDRVLGYGLKYSDHFQHTHLGWLKKKPEET